MLVSLYRTDVANQTGLIATIDSYQTASDQKFLMAAQSKNDTGLSLIPGNRVMPVSSAVTLQTMLMWKNNKNATAVVLDEEPHIKWSDFNTDLQNAHAAGLKFHVSPVYNTAGTNDIQANYTTLAKADEVVLQMNTLPKGGLGVDSGLSYAQVVQKYVSLMKAANPNVLIISYYSAGQVRAQNDANQTAIVNAYNSVKNITDGVMFWYYNSTATSNCYIPPCIDAPAAINNFYNATGILKP